MQYYNADQLIKRPTRRHALIEKIKKAYPDKKGALFFCAGFEGDREPLYQDSTFHYFVGLDEPALMLYQPLDGQAVLYEPLYSTARSVWLPIKKNDQVLSQIGVAKVEVLGQAVQGYSSSPFFSKEALENLIACFKQLIERDEYLFVPLTDVSNEPLYVIKSLCTYLPGLEARLIDSAPYSAQLRRVKDHSELEFMYRAIEITAAAQEAAAVMIKPEMIESQVQAAIDYVFADGQATRAFASVVGSGKNSTVLHYVDNKDRMKVGDLVVVDIGASYQHYAADVTRTYPVTGKFTERQKEIYQCVLDTQTFVAEYAAPGMYLTNADQPEKSLHHLARKFLEERGMLAYFPHGIGHFVGLDVHDVGNRLEPLQPGDIITIEPGIYIVDEKLGVRIEDMYWIVEDGVVCITDGIPKEISEVEELMQSSLADD